jgi:hypothetical protein
MSLLEDLAKQSGLDTSYLAMLLDFELCLSNPSYVDAVLQCKAVPAREWTKAVNVHSSWNEHKATYYMFLLEDYYANSLWCADRRRICRNPRKRPQTTV